MHGQEQQSALARRRAAWGAAFARVESHRRALFIATIAIVVSNASLLSLRVILVGDMGWRFGIDYHQYMFATDSWLHGSGFYRLWQLTGSYPIPVLTSSLPDLPVLYPPVAILLFLPWTLMPALWPLWWAIPLGIIAVCVMRMRPRALAWPAMAVLAMSTESMWLTLSGNPIIWSTAAFACGLLVGWPAVFVVLKPTMAPFALVGIRSRGWWIALALLAAASVPFGSMWLDWIAAIRNSDGNVGYGLNNVPLFLFVLLVWLGRTTARRTQIKR